MPTHWAFYFQGSSLPLSVSVSQYGSMCRVHIALQELQAVDMMLHRIAFHLSGKVVALLLDNSTAKAYLCNQDGTVSLFLSRLAWQILSLNDKHSITPIPSYIPTHLSVGADYMSWCHLLLSGIFSQRIAQVAFCLWALGGFAGNLLYHSMPALLYTGNSTAYGGLGVQFFQSSLDVSVKLCVSSCCIMSSSSVQVSGRTCQRSSQAFDSDGTMLDGGSLAFHSSQHVGRCSSALAHHKRSCGCFGHVLKGLPYLHLTLWLLRDESCADRGSFPQSVRQW